jgi:hypothetical protein
MEEWNGADGKGFGCSAGPCGPLIALAVPEAKPERIAIVTKTTEFLCAVDGEFDICPGSREMMLNDLIDIIDSTESGKVGNDAYEYHRT